MINIPSPPSKVPVLIGSISDVLEHVGKFDNFFRKSERFARNYANTPNMYKDGRIGTIAKANLIALFAPGQATQLMNSQTTRYYVVAAVIDRWTSSFFHGMVSLLHFEKSLPVLCLTE